MLIKQAYGQYGQENHIIQLQINAWRGTPRPKLALPEARTETSTCALPSSQETVDHHQISTAKNRVKITFVLSVRSSCSWPLPIVAASPSPTTNALSSNSARSQTLLCPVLRSILHWWRINMLNFPSYHSEIIQIIGTG